MLKIQSKWARVYPMHSVYLLIFLGIDGIQPIWTHCTMVVGVKTHPITQLLNGVGLVGVSGFVVVFCEKIK